MGDVGVEGRQMVKKAEVYERLSTYIVVLGHVASMLVVSRSSAPIRAMRSQAFKATRGSAKLLRPRFETITSTDSGSSVASATCHETT